MMKIQPGNLLITNKETKEMYLCKVIGTPPMLDIIAGINLSSFYKDGSVVKIGPKSPIITDIKNNPFGYEFEDGLGIISVENPTEEIEKASKIINIKDADIANYKSSIMMYGKDADTKFKFSKMKDGLTALEATALLAQIKSAIKR